VIADLLVLVHGALTVAGPPTAGNAEKSIRWRRTASRRRGGNLHGAQRRDCSEPRHRRRSLLRPVVPVRA
jgi:hypothetical protein